MLRGNNVLCAAETGEENTFWSHCQIKIIINNVKLESSLYFHGLFCRKRENPSLLVAYV